MATFQTEQEILAALSSPGSFGRDEAVSALVNDIGYASFDAEELVDEWIEDLEWRVEHKGQEREWEWEQ